MPATHRASGRRYKDLFERVVRRGIEAHDNIVEMLLADGFPPFSAPQEDQRALYQTLTAMKAAGNIGNPQDPYYGNPAAVRTLQRLEAIYGPGSPSAGPFPQPPPAPQFPPGTPPASPLLQPPPGPQGGIGGG